MSDLVLNNFIAAYIYAVAAFLLFRLFSQSAKQKTVAFLNAANGIVLFILAINLFVTIDTTIGLNSRKLAGSYFSVPANFFLLVTITLGFAFQSLFIRKKLRIKIWTTLVSMLLLFALLNLEKLLILITSLSRDYLVSNWSVYYADSSGIIESIITITYFAICWSFSRTKEKKLQV